MKVKIMEHACCKHNDASDSQEDNHYKELLKKSLFAGIPGLLLFIVMLLNILPQISTLHGQIVWLIIGVITFILMLYSGNHIFKGAWIAFINNKANMDTLILLGTGAAWFFSMFVAIRPNSIPLLAQNLYFEAALIIIALVNFGAALEMHARGKTSQAIQKLVGLQPNTARVLRNGIEVDINIKDVLVGDIIRIKPGEKIPVDGIIIEGQSTIDESMLTGEPTPTSKSIDSQISAGTINKTGSFLFKATRVGKDTVLSQIINLVQQAQNTKPPIARLVDVISSYFVPTVIVISLITTLAWFNFGPEPKIGFMLVTAMTVLIIACPCALGLATPISIMVGMGKAAEHGVLIRNGIALQQATKINTIVLDKTGTITKGRPEVTTIYSIEPGNEMQLLQLAASLENGSEHPYADAIVRCAKDKQMQLLEIKNFETISGKGVQALLDNKKLLLGNQQFMMDHHVSISNLVVKAQELENLGHTPMYLAVDQKIKGIIAAADTIKDDSKAAISHLKSLGIKVVMLTGDNKKAANIIAKQLNIDAVYAEIMPHEKVLKIKELQNQGNIVGMVGDGINDAPALAQADVGFAISSGTDVAIESADVTLMRNSIYGVVYAIAISRATMRNIKQNLFGAFVYNILGIPIAAGALYPFMGMLLNPMVAGAAMALSSVTVVSNANRLRWFKIIEG